MFLWLNAKAQQSLSGRVQCADGKPGSGAAILLKSWKDTALVASAIADSTGAFRYAAVQSGRYRLSVSLVGFATQTAGPVTIQSSAIALPLIILQPAGGVLQEVTVTAQKNFVEQKVDRTVVNVNAMISNTGANALEVLEKSPGIIVDENGNISFKGKTGVMVMIDDKPTYLSGDNLVSYLRSLPASQLEQIELMATPPARYDASGNSGVINIRTKKIKTRGFNGNTALSTAVNNQGYWRTLESLVLNYRVNKINLFANAGYGLQNNYRRLDLHRSYFDNNAQLLSTYRETAFFHPLNHNYNLKLGMDYSVNSRTTAGIALTGALTKGKSPASTSSTIGNRNGAADSVILADNHTDSRFSNEGINLNFLRQLKRPSQVLTVDLDYVQYHSRQEQEFTNNTYHASGNLTYQQVITDNLPTVVHIYAAKSDYVHPFANGGKIEAGVKTSFVDTDNEANYFNVVSNNKYPDYDKTNRFLYKENINAAYLTYSHEHRRISLKLGLRAENSRIDAHQLGNPMRADSAFTKAYTDLFPTAYASYKLDTTGNHTLNLSYGRRIDRPGYRQLNPFVTLVDKYSTWVGNPFLRPQYATNLQLTYSFKSIFSISLQYAYTKDFQSEVDLQEGDKFVAHTYNFDRAVNRGITVFTAIPFTRWWTFNLNGELINNAYEGAVPGVTLKADMTYCYTNINNQLNFKNGWSAELGGFYLTPGRYGQFVRRAFGQLNAGVQKKMFGNKATLKIGVRDLLRTNITGGDITNITNVAATYRNDFANRTLSLGFTYNFGSDANAKKKRETGSSDSEQRRVGL
ncbi:outer membrane beta-barrel protein [Sediminibacterium soli]|uniref:outer membrane beta-barrel protein n=1 Tax=Sediminibacterium soli TaxID=2698829 RepID=UPI0013797C52|nr:outer membrane beta-barrel protein [Sediminibacterium soli]NCI46433.1 outer membrane beta-barrel protein [Sediminibacterium soli]